MAILDKRTKDNEYYFSVRFWVILLIGLSPALIEFTQKLFVIQQLANLNEWTAHYQEQSIGVIRWLLLYLLPNLIAIVVVAILAYTRIIDWRALSWNHVLNTLLLVIFCDELLGYNADWARTGLGEQAAIAIEFVGFYSEAAFLTTAWRWLVICVYLLAISHRIKSNRRMVLLTVVALIGLTGVALVLHRAVYRSLHVSEAILPYVEDLSQAFIGTSWINRIVTLYITLIIGLYSWKASAVVMQTLFKVVVAWMLRPILVYNIQMGIAGIPVAEMIALIVTGLICLLYQRNLQNRKCIVFHSAQAADE